MTTKQFNQLMGTINDIKAEVAELRSEVDALKGKSSKKTSSSKTVSTSKSAPKKTASSKVTKTGKEFDRAVYEKTAKKLKVWNKAKGKVNKVDREKVYAEMRKMGYDV